MNVVAAEVRRILRNRHSILGVMSILAMPAAMAQQSSAPATTELEEVTVVGTRASLESALIRKREAGTVVDSIVAEDIAQFPDKNVGEALARITGVQLSRDFGEGTGVSIRGVDPALNRVEINGASVLTAGGPGQAQRSADFRELASELIKTVDVIKGSTADITEGGIGGTVRIELRKPLELKGPLFSATFSEQKLTTQGDWTPRANVTAATQLFDNRFGVMANVTYDKVVTRGDFARNTEWVRMGDWDNSAEKTITSLDSRYAAVTTEAGCMTAFTGATDQNNCRQQWWDYSPRIPRYGIWYREDERISGQVTLQFKLTERQEIWAEGTFTDRQQFLNDHNYGTDFTAVNRVAAAPGDVYNGLAGSSNVNVDQGHHVVGYTVAPTTAGSSAAFGTSSRGFDLSNETTYYSLGYLFEGDRLQAKVSAARTDSFRDDETNSANFTAAVPGLRVELDGNGTPRFLFPQGFSMEDDNVYTQIQLQYRPSESELTEDMASVDFDFDLKMPVLTTLEFGGQFRETESVFYGGGGYLDAATGVNVPTYNINITANHTPGTGANTVTPGTGINALHQTYSWNTATFRQALAASTRSPSTFFDGYDISGMPSNWRVPVFDQLATMMDTSDFNHSGLYQVDVNGRTFDQIPANDITEDVGAGYLKVNFDTELWGGVRLLGNVGVRYVSTGVDAAGVLTRRERRSAPTASDPLAFTDVTVGNSYVAIEDDYSDTLPSANFNFVINDQFSVRLGYAELMARPGIDKLAPAANCLYDTRPGFSGDSDPDDCTAGNPALKPYRADSYDLEFAYYPTNEIELRLGGFYKDIETFILGNTLVRGVDFFGDGTLFDVTMPINGEGAKTKGVEVSVQAPFTFLPGWMSGFGGMANYTYTDADDVNLFSQLDGSPLTFPGLSENSYNLVLYYDRGPVNARLAYNSRSDWLAAAADRSGNPVYRTGENYLDARVQYRFLGGKASVFVEGKNLTDEASVTSAGDSPIRLSELGWYGRRYFIGASYKIE